MFILALILLNIFYSSQAQAQAQASAQFSYYYRESLLQGWDFVPVRFNLESTELQEIENSFKLWKCKKWNPRNSLSGSFNVPGTPDYLSDEEACELVLIKLFLDRLYWKSPLKSKVGIEETVKVGIGVSGSDCHSFSITTANWIAWLSQKKYLDYFSLGVSDGLNPDPKSFMLTHEKFGIPNVHVATPLRILRNTKKFIVLDAWLADKRSLSARTMIFSESDFVGIVNNMKESSSQGSFRNRE